MDGQENTPAPDAAPEAAPDPVVEDVAPIEDAPVDTPTDAPVDAPVEGEAPPVEEPPAPEPFGGYFADETEAQAAQRLYQATQSEDGVISLFLEAGRNLGLGLKEMQALFDDLSGQEPAEEPDLDEPLTRGEFLAEQQKREAAAAAAEAERVRSAASSAVDSTMAELGVAPTLDGKPNPAYALVLQLGDKHFDDKNITPESAAEAVRRGHAEYQALVERESQAYLARKKAKADAVPAAPVGAGPAAEPPAEEPTSVAEAIKIARKKHGLV